MSFDDHLDALNGAFSAIFTPMHPDGSINLDMLSQIADFQLQHGVRGFFATGSTGEGLLLSLDERLAVIKHLASQFSDRATVIAHVGHPSTDVAAQLAKDSAAAGADWIASVGPIYHGTTFEGAYRHYRQIAAATDLPFMIYAIGTEVVPQRDCKFFELPNICGLKYTGANFYSVQQLARIVDRPIAMLSGFDEQFVAGQSFGFSGGIGSTFNFAPQYYAQIYDHYHQGNIAEAARLQAEINRVTHFIVQYENWSYRKAVMKYLGFDCGAYRAPYAPLTEQQYEAFATELDNIGVLQRDIATAV